MEMLKQQGVITYEIIGGEESDENYGMAIKADCGEQVYELFIPCISNQPQDVCDLVKEFIRSAVNKVYVDDIVRDFVY